MIDASSTLANLTSIALVDDNEYDNEYHEIIFGKAGYRGRLLVFLSAEAALVALTAGDEHVDVIFLDINLPGMNGFEFAQRLSGLPRDASAPTVVVLTSSSDPSDMQQAAAIDTIRAFVTKPLTPAMATDVIAKVAASVESADRAVRGAAPAGSPTGADASEGARPTANGCTAGGNPFAVTPGEPEPPVAGGSVGTGPLSAWLRAETRWEHRAIEKRLDLDRRVVRTSALAALLRGWNQVWLQVLDEVREPATCAAARVELEACAEQALAWLRVDLEELADLAPVVRLPDPHLARPMAAARLGLLHTTAGSWGVGYVLRGARIGSSLLAPRIHASLKLPPGVGTRYLSSQGSDIGREWVTFKRRLDAWGATLRDGTSTRSALIPGPRSTPFGCATPDPQRTGLPVEAVRTRDAAKAGFRWVGATLTAAFDAAAARLSCPPP